MTNTSKTTIFTIPPDTPPTRLDQALAHYHAPLSRSFFQELIKKRLVSINNLPATKASITVKSGDQILFTLPSTTQPTPQKSEQLQALGVEVLYEHHDFLVIAKPPGLLVHKPHHKSTVVTLVDWLLAYHQEIVHVGSAERPGIIHRLDKDTSGLLLIARTPQAHTVFSALFKERRIKKQYLALVEGHPPAKGIIDYSIRRDPFEPIKMTHTGAGRTAETSYTVLQLFETGQAEKYALLELKPVTGRTHQIRVHCAAIGHPLVGDIVYGKKSSLLKRQALHAHALAFEYQDKQYQFTKAPPSDFLEALEHLEKSSK